MNDETTDVTASEPTAAGVVLDGPSGGLVPTGGRPSASIELRGLASSIRGSINLVSRPI